MTVDFRKISIPVLSLMLVCSANVHSQQQTPSPLKKLTPAKLDYEIEWHLIRAGVAHVDLTENGKGWQVQLHLESAGTVSRLYRVLDNYRVQTDARLCPSSAVLDAQESKRHKVTRLTFDGNRHQVTYRSQDLVKNTTTENQLQVAPCTREILSALMALRTLGLDPGKSGAIAITDGKKFVNARVEAQAKETISVDGVKYSTVRYEAFLFDNVLYKRKGRLFIWVSEDVNHFPVQLRFQMGFPIGNVLVQLQSQPKS